LTKSENETNKIGERERERERYLGEINETLAPPIKAAAAEVDGDVALKLYTEDRKREMRNSESANLKRRERNRYLKRIERERGELERRRKWRTRAAAQATADGLIDTTR
jgi:hypothetical protein